MTPLSPPKIKSGCSNEGFHKKLSQKWFRGMTKVDTDLYNNIMNYLSNFITYFKLKLTLELLSY